MGKISNAFFFVFSVIIYAFGWLHGKTIGKLKIQFSYWRYKRAVKKAEKLAKLTRYKYLVVKSKNSFQVFTRRQLKALLATKKYFAPGTTIEFLESKAAYKTY